MIEYRASSPPGWVVSHAAHGDEQLCVLKLGEGAGGGEDDENRLALEFSDTETRCKGWIEADGTMRGVVGQLQRPEENFWQDSDPDLNRFELKPVVGGRASSAAKTLTPRVERLLRWSVTRAVWGDLHQALGKIQGRMRANGMNLAGNEAAGAVSYTHLTLPTTPYV